jgi:hypothetical protein
MIIMQTIDAIARKELIESAGLSKVIFCHELDDAVCVQYHPKGIKGSIHPNSESMFSTNGHIGGIIPELDSHHSTPSNPTPLLARFSPWHTCGPPSKHSTYAAGMRRQADLHLLSTTLRLKPMDTDTVDASKQWEQVFGVKAEGAEVAFTNATLKFIPGLAGEPEGIVEIRIGVEGKKRLGAIIELAKDERVVVDEREGAVEMLGVRFHFVLAEQGTRSML